MPKKLFSLAPKGDVTVTLNVKLKGEPYELKHIFREPTAEDKKGYWRHMSKTEITGRQQKQSMDYFGAVEFLYDRCIKDVEGYDKPAGVKDWKKLIPIEHKQWAVEALQEEVGLPEEEQKN